MSVRDRGSYAEVARAARGVIDAALGDPATTPADLRVLLALVREVTLYSRTSDRVSRARLAELAGISERSVSRSLGRLARFGVEWSPGGNGRDSTVTLRASSGTQLCLATSVESARVAGHAGPSSETQLCPSSGTPRCLTPEKASEKVSEESRDRGPLRDLLTRPTDELVDEVATILREFAEAHTPARADAAVAALLSDDRRHRWPSQVRMALDAWNRENPPRKRCVHGHNGGVHLDANGVAYRCPDWREASA